MTELLLSPVETQIAPPEDIQALGYLGVNGAMQAEAGVALGAENDPAIAETANYEGNWLLAQQERMDDPDFKAKYEDMVQDSLPQLKEGRASIFVKPEDLQSYHQGLAGSVDTRREHVYSAVGYAPASQFNAKPHHTGVGSIGERGTVFADATTREGVPLNDRQKDIIAAHEAYHGMVTLPKAASEKVKSGIDAEALYNYQPSAGEMFQPNYLNNADELTARMAQLKNYFGMKGGEDFTKAHLDYARSHYVEDTGLDNAMSLMMKMVTPKTESEFIHLMNTFPI
jgi:hypothetical protein